MAFLVVLAFGASAVASAPFVSHYAVFLRPGHSSVFLFIAATAALISGVALVLILVQEFQRRETLARANREMKGALDARAAAVDASMDGIVITDPAGIVRYVNQAALALCGAGGPGEVVGLPWRKLYSREQNERFDTEIIPALNFKKRWRGGCHGLRFDGTEYIQDVSISQVADGGFVLIVRDNTEMVERDETSRQRLAAIEAAGDGIGIVGKDGTLGYINHSLMELHGLSLAEAADYIGHPWEKLYTGRGGEEIRRDVLPQLRKNGHWKGEAPIVRKDGSTVFAEMTLTLLGDGGIVGTARDITERKRTEKEKEELRNQFFQAQKMEAIGRLAGGIAHDFNNILASILGYAEFLVEDLDEKTDQHRFVRQIVHGGLQARHLVEQILTFSRRNESVKDVVNVADTIRETHAMLRATLPVTITLDTDMEVGEAFISGNATQISQMLMNLCVNAVDAMENEQGVLKVSLKIADAEESVYGKMMANQPADGEGRLPFRIEEDGDGCVRLCLGSLEAERKYVSITVSDTGCGMPREVMEHIFEPFFTTKSVEKGTGLGLSTVHGLLAGHGGAMIVTSRKGAGTVFELLLPEAENGKEAAGTEAPAGIIHGQGRILIVEDQEKVRDMLASMVGRMGYEIRLCESALHAIDVLREDAGNYDVVLSDYTMPGISGAEMATCIHEDFPGLPVVIISGYSRKRLETLVEENPAIAAALPKPVDAAALSRELKKATEKRKRAA